MLSVRLTCLVVALGVVLAVGSTPAAAQTSEAEVSVAQAILEYDAKNYTKALEYLKEALAADPKNAEAHYYTGLVLGAQGKRGEAVTAFEKARTAAPTDLAISYQLGLAYFSEKDYRKAEGPLEQVFKAAPKTDGVGYYLGHVKFKRGDYSGALGAFRAGASTDPDVQQLTRVYTGYTLAALGKPAEADAEIKQGLAVQGATAVPATVSDRLRQGVSTAAPAERPFRAEVSFGILYDNNVGILPRVKGNVARTGSADITAENTRDERPIDSFGETFGVNLGYTFLKTGPWQADVGFSFFRINYNDEPHFNSNNYLFSLGGSYRNTLLGMPWTLSAQYAYDDTTLAGDAFLSRHTAAASWTLVENAGNLSTFLVRYQDKDFSQIDNDIRSGLAGFFAPPGTPQPPLTSEFRSAANWLVGVSHMFRFEGDRHYLYLGFQYDSENADGRNYSYDGFRYLVGGQYTLPWYKIRTKYDFDLHQRYYRNKNTILNTDFVFCHRCPFTREREDTEQNHTLTIEVPLPYNLTLTLQQLFSAVNSNLDLFAFDRNLTSLSITWRY